jgi:hypothetical protein
MKSRHGSDGRPLRFRASLNRNRVRSAWPALILPAVCLVGCGGDARFATVTGKVLLDGTPVEGAFVEFLSTEDQGSTSYGRTDATGTFRMRKSDTQSGVYKGRCLVRIHTGDSGRSPGESVPERLPDVYHKQSEIHCDVVDSRHAFLFELTTAGDAVSPKPIE